MGRNTNNNKSVKTDKKAVKRAVDEIEGTKRSTRSRKPLDYKKLNEGIDFLSDNKEIKTVNNKKLKLSKTDRATVDNAVASRENNSKSSKPTMAVLDPNVCDVNITEHEIHNMNEFINSFNDGIQVAVDASDLEAFDEQEELRENERRLAKRGRLRSSSERSRPATGDRS